MKLLLSNEKIKKNISRIAKNIRDEYEKEIKNLTILTVLDGAAWVYSLFNTRIKRA